MGIVATNKLKPGMLLAEDVRDVNNRRILAKGKKIHSLDISDCPFDILRSDCVPSV